MLEVDKSLLDGMYWNLLRYWPFGQVIGSSVSPSCLPIEINNCPC